MAIERGKSASNKYQTRQPATTAQTRTTQRHQTDQQDGATAQAQQRGGTKHTKTKSINPVLKTHSKPWTYTRRGYALAQSFRQLFSRKLASLVTLLVFGITMALPALIFFTANSLAELGNKSVGEESVTAYLNLQTSDLEGAALAQRLQNQAGVKSARYVSRDEALAIFYEQADIGDAVNVLGENPLPGAIILYPDNNTLNDAAMSELATRIESIDSVDRVQFDLRWVQRLQAVLNMARTVGWILAGFLTLTALLVIGNTIRLELLRRQSEFDVSRLLGASKSFLNRPLLYTGALYGFLGGVIACGIALMTLYWLRGPAAQLSSLYTSAFELILPTASQLLTVVATATILGLLGAIVTLYQPANQFLQNRRTGI